MALFLLSAAASFAAASTSERSISSGCLGARDDDVGCAVDGEDDRLEAGWVETKAERGLRVMELSVGRPMEAIDWLERERGSGGASFG